MCGRYTLYESPDKLAEWFEMELDESFDPNYNVAPTQWMPVAVDGKIQRFKWGLLPFWAKDQKVSYSMINARAETLASKRSFSDSFKSHRCLVPASGFYEWTGQKGNKTPHFIYPTNAPVFAFAGLYNVWKSPEGESVPTYTIVTTQANKKLEPLHDRMPAALLREEWDQWLDSEFQDTDALQGLLDPYPDDALDYYQVTKNVNSVKNNTPDLIERA